MCGIVGIYNLNNSLIDKKELKNFTNSLKHRGPDANGIYVDDKQNLGLGHTRIRIFDISDSADQPMLYNDNQYVIVYNGEIYNFLELKVELKELGYKFKTTSDTEVILASYMAWKEKCQFKFNGDWAFTIWDNRNKSLFMSRDRFGVKPFYYLLNDNKLFFASELKAFMSLNEENIPGFNYFQFVHASKDFTNSSYEITEDTFLKNVKELNPGYQLTIKQNKSFELKKWWSTIENLIEIPKKYNDQVEKYKQLFFSACKLRLRSDVKIAISLSGGIDSSSLAASINNIKNIDKDSKNMQFPHNAFILNYKNDIDSEMNYAKLMLEHININAIFVDLEIDKINPEEVVKSIYHQEEVNGFDGLGPWFLFKKIKENNIKVNFVGLSADELLAGYAGYLRPAMNECKLPAHFFHWLDLLLIHLKMKDTSLENNNNLTLLIKNLYQFINLKITASKKNHAIDYDFFLIESKKSSSLPQDDISSLSLLNKALYVDYHYKSNPLNCRRYDKFSMAHGVECRSPFLDSRLATYSFSLPSRCKIGNGFTKRILRDSMRGIVANKVLNRSKKGLFDTSNYLFNKSMINFIHDVIYSKDFCQSDIWDGKKIRNFVEKNKTIQYKKIFKYIQIYFLMKTFNSDKKYN